MGILNPYAHTNELDSSRIPMGINVRTGKKASLSTNWLKTHLHVIGSTGGGKSYFLLWLFTHLVRLKRATVVVIDPKGGLHEMCRDWCMAHGYTNRLVLFEPGNTERVCGYNIAFPSSLPIGSHAKLMRESIEAGFGQSSIDFASTPQLHRLLFLVMYAIRELNLTLSEALSLIRPESALRSVILPRIQNPYVKEAFEYFDSLQARRQEELASSSIARIEPWILDDNIRRIFTSPQPLIMQEVLRENKILLVNLSKGRPLRRDDSFLIGRLLLNDLLNKGLEIDQAERGPLFVIADEVQNVATLDLTDCLDEGRGNGLHFILAHQYLAQLQEEERSGHLYHSVMNDARTRVVFGGGSPEDTTVLTDRMFLGDLNPYAIKDELTSLELEPFETTRIHKSVSASHTDGSSQSHAAGTSSAQTESETHGTGRSVARSHQETLSKVVTKGMNKTSSSQQGKSAGTGTNWGETDTDGTSWTDSDTDGESSSSSASSGMRDNPNGGDPIHTSSATTGGGTSSSHTASEGGSHSHATSRGGSASRGSSESRGRSFGINRSVAQGHAVSDGITKTESEHHDKTTGTTRSVSAVDTIGTDVSDTIGHSETIVPFYEYVKRRNITSRTFLSLEEQKLLLAQLMEKQAVAHAVLKVPTKSAVFLKLPHVTPAFLSPAKRHQKYEIIFAREQCYLRPEEIDQAEQERTAQLFLAAPSDETLQSNHGVKNGKPRRAKTTNRAWEQFVKTHERP